MFSSRSTPFYSVIDEGVNRGKYIVRGIRATSYEYNFAMALERYELEYQFQVSFMGGRRLLGGIVIDFIVFTVPLPTPVYIDEQYWHKGGRSEIDWLQRVLVHYYMRNALAPVLVLYREDVETIDAAIAAVRREFL